MRVEAPLGQRGFFSDFQRGSGEGQVMGDLRKFKSKTANVDVDVSKNRGTPKWMVYNGKPYSNG